MHITDLDSLKQQFEQINSSLFGAGVNAFNRLGLEKISSSYRILNYNYTLDTELIKKEVEIFPSYPKKCRKYFSRRRRNATTILDDPRIQKYLRQFPDPAILVYKPSEKMEEIVKENNWKLIANSTDFGKNTLENKSKFREILKNIGVPPSPGKTTSVQQLHYGRLMNKYGLPLVMQHPTRGGGKGTFFINNKQDFDNALEKITSSKPAENVIISQYIDGPSPSTTGCATKGGILSVNLQHQLLDIPQLYQSDKGAGLFCGHDWSASDFPEEINRQANEYTEKVGQYLRKQGYKGIFGLDFVLDKRKKQLYVTECNPRLLGSYPVMNMVQMLNQEPLLLAFHVLEFLNIDYSIDPARINDQLRQKKTGAQMILHNLTERQTKNHAEVAPGVYELKNSRLHYKRAGYDLEHLKNKEEFLITDGVPFKKTRLNPQQRICRLLTMDQVMDDSDHRQLNPRAREIAEKVYQSFDIRPSKLHRLTCR